MLKFSFLLAAFAMLTSTCYAEEPIVTDTELKIVGELVELQKQKFASGSGNMTEVYSAERLYLKAQYWAAKIKREEFIEKANALHMKNIVVIKSQFQLGIVNNTALLEAYQNMFEDRRIQ